MSVEKSSARELISSDKSITAVQRSNRGVWPHDPARGEVDACGGGNYVFQVLLISTGVPTMQKNYSYNDNYNNNFLEVIFIIQEDSKAGGQEDRRNP